MVCDVIDECRCYAFRGEKKQFCGVRKGPEVLLCPSDCCHGGCDNGPPFRYIDRKDTFVQIGNVNVLLGISIVVIVYLLVIFTNLKTKRVR